MAEALPFPWDTFFQLQAVTDTRVISARSHAREEALSELLEELAVGAGPSDTGAMQRRYWALTTNRAKKYRHRTGLADQVAYHHQLGHQALDHSEIVALQELVTLASCALPHEDRDLLDGVASSGMAYREIALQLGKPVGTVKARVSRLRRQIRDSHVGRTIQLAMAAA